MATTLDDYVVITISRNQVGVSAVGFGVQMILGYTATWSDRIRFYADLPSMTTDGFTTDSPEYLAAQAAFAQTPRPTQVAIGRGLLKPTQAYAIGTNSLGSVGTTYSIAVAGKGVTATTVSFTTLSDLVGTLLPRTGNTLTFTAHGMSTGDGPYYVSNSGGALPGGLTVNTPYWIINITANTFQFASTKANAIALTPVTLTTDGTGTQTILRGASNQDVVIQQLLQGLNAVVGANYTAATTGSPGSISLTITATAPGNWFSLSINDPALLSNKQTHADPGVATDLNNIYLASPSSWYGLSTVYNSQAYVVAAAGWIETNTRIYIPHVVDTLALTTAGGTGGTADTLDQLDTNSYSRTMGAYHPTPAAMMGPAWLGKMLPKDPGSATFKFKTLATVPVVNFTSTQKANLLTRHGNSLQLVAGLSITFEGTSADGEYLDAIVGDDWVKNDMQTRVFNVEAGGDKVEYEDTGIADIEAAMIATLKEAVRRKIYAASPAPVVTAPDISTIPLTDKQTRTLNNMKFTAVRSGAIHKVNIQGNVLLG